MLAQSRAIVESVHHHESVIVECESILKGLNPTYAKEKDQEAEIKGLNEKISELEKKLGGIEEIKQMLLNQKTNGVS